MKRKELNIKTEKPLSEDVQIDWYVRDCSFVRWIISFEIEKVEQSQKSMTNDDLNSLKSNCEELKSFVVFVRM